MRSHTVRFTLSVQEVNSGAGSTTSEGASETRRGEKRRGTALAESGIGVDERWKAFRSNDVIAVPFGVHVCVATKRHHPRPCVVPVLAMYHGTLWSCRTGVGTATWFPSGHEIGTIPIRWSVACGSEFSRSKEGLVGTEGIQGSRCIASDASRPWPRRRRNVAFVEEITEAEVPLLFCSHTTTGTPWCERRSGWVGGCSGCGQPRDDAIHRKCPTVRVAAGYPDSRPPIRSSDRRPPTIDGSRSWRQTSTRIAGPGR